MMIRLFGSKECGSCLTIQKELELAGLEYLFIDALDDDTQSLCDLYNVEELPHIQICNENGEVLFQKVGYVPIEDLLKLLDTNSHDQPE